MPRVAEVLLPLPLAPLSYLVPFETAAGPVGGRVVVPWQGGLRTGLCVGLREASAAESLDLRELIAWLDTEPWFAAGAVQLLADLAEHTAAPQGLLLTALAPVGFTGDLVHELRALAETGVADLDAGDWLAAERLDAALIEELRGQGLLAERVAERPRTVTRLVAVDAGMRDESELEGAARTAQRNALAELRRGDAASAAELARRAGVSESPVRALVTKGFAEYRELPAPEPELPLPLPATLESSVVQPPRPTPERPLAVAGGLRRDRLAALLPLLQADLAAGRSPLILAPEVAWLEEAVAQLLPHAPVLMLSGAMDDARRARFWREAASGVPRIVAGTYPALLAPLPDPGTLVVLESAATSWKLPSGARLFVPAAARRLAALAARPLVLTEVTENAELRAGSADIFRLPGVAQRIHVSDLNHASGWPLDADLVRVLRQVAERGRQAVVLSSRRGFSGALSCRDCGAQVQCPHCDLPLRYHRAGGRLRCHQCGFDQALPRECSECGGSEFAPTRAAGTQWLADTVAGVAPGLPVLRFDGDRQDDLAPLYAGEPGVLVATVAALRRPPLPNVSLIAVALFDAHAGMSDFRAGEATLRLLLQLPELTTQRRPLTVIQTFQPQNRVLTVLTADDQAAALDAFVTETCERRAAFGYPPYALLARAEISARTQPAAESAAERLAGTLRAAGAMPEEVLGPTPAPVARVRGRFVQHLLLRSRDDNRFRWLLGQVPRGGDGARVRLDVDPRDVGATLE